MWISSCSRTTGLKDLNHGDCQYPLRVLQIQWNCQNSNRLFSEVDNLILKIIWKIIKHEMNEHGTSFFVFMWSFSSVQFSCSVVSDSLGPHGLQHARPPCPSPTPRVYSNSCPLSRWCHPTISSSVITFCYLQSFPASGSFQMSQLLAWGGQTIGV